MGYSYSKNASGRRVLDCDICNEPGARKYPCPFGYCQAIAACPKCRKERAELFGRKSHRAGGCEQRHNEYHAKLAHEAALIMTGQPVRCAALNVGGLGVHVLFAMDTQHINCIGYYMPSQTYAAIGLGETATPDDYRKHGELTPAPANFY